MTISLKSWTHPKTGAIRVYVRTFHEWHATGRATADGSYFYAGEDGEIRAWFRPSWSGEFGHATHEVMRYLGLDRISFAELLERMEAAKTPAGNFSEVRYFKNLAAEKVAA